MPDYIDPAWEYREDSPDVKEEYRWDDLGSGDTARSIADIGFQPTNNRVLCHTRVKGYSEDIRIEEELFKQHRLAICANMRCASPFKPYRNNRTGYIQRYCSCACAPKPGRHRIIPRHRVCRFCKKGFKPKRREQFYCSTSCVGKASPHASMHRAVVGMILPMKYGKGLSNRQIGIELSMSHTAVKRWLRKLTQETDRGG